MQRTTGTTSAVSGPSMAEPLVRLRPRLADLDETPARWRIVACPPAGAGAQYYRPLVRADVQVWSVRYPGRESRIAEPFARSIAQLADEVTRGLAPLLAPGGGDDLPTVLLGHSMGARVAIEVARRLRHATSSAGGCLALLALSASEAAVHHERDDADDLRRISADDVALRDWLVGLGGVPAELLADEDFMAMQLPIVRADLTASLDHVIDPHTPRIDVPMMLLCGDRDPVVRLEDMVGWATVTSADVRELALRGGHDAVIEDAATLLDAMEDLMASAGAPAPRRAKEHA